MTWEKEVTGTTTVLRTGNPRGVGIAIHVHKKRKSFSIYGWYDGGYGGIRGAEITLDQLQELLTPECKGKRK